MCLFCEGGLGGWRLRIMLDIECMTKVMLDVENDVGCRMDVDGDVRA